MAFDKHKRGHIYVSYMTILIIKSLWSPTEWCSQLLSIEEVVEISIQSMNYGCDWCRNLFVPMIEYFVMYDTGSAFTNSTYHVVDKEFIDWLYFRYPSLMPDADNSCHLLSAKALCLSFLPLGSRWCLY